MKKAPPPFNEANRLKALERYGILDTPPDAVLDCIAQAAADLCETPIALISLIDPSRQWFKTCIGMPARETSRDLAFCTHAILDPTQLMEVEDASQDERFHDNPLVTGEPKIRFYAGKPLVTSDQFALGTLCVIDDKPRRLTAAQRNGLSRLAQTVMELLEERQGSKIAAIDRAIDQAVRHGVLITDPCQPDNPITYVNQAIEVMTGYSKAELIGKNCRLLQGQDTDATSVAQLREAIATHEPCTVILKNYRKDGSMFWNELTVSPVKDRMGSTINYVGIQNDVTDQQLAEERITELKVETAEGNQDRATRNRLAQIVEVAMNEIYVSSADTYELLSANQAARKNLGYTEEESQQLMPWDFVEGLTQENMEELVGPLRSGVLDVQEFETVHRRKDGSTYPVAAKLKFMSTQRPPVYVAVVQDISERRHQSEMIKLRDLAIESLDVGVTITDATKENHPLVYANQTLCALTGYTTDELLGHGVRMLQSGDQQPEHLKIQEAQAQGKSVQVVFKSTRKDGSQYMDELSLSPVRNAAGELTHYIGINRDVTSKLDTEARLRQAQKIDAIGQLSGGIAHDFNNLLNVITGNLEFLAMEITDESQRDFLNEADGAAQMGARLTRRLLKFAKQSSLEPEVLNANEYVIGAMELLRSTIGDAVSLSSNLSPDLWNICTDPSEIENTVVNLAINARDAMPGGGKIVIETKNVNFTEDDIEDGFDVSPGDYIQLSVTDNGSGMSDEIKARIFEPFFTTKEPGKGTGLGLASIYGYVNQSGGHIHVYSEVGHGTAINLYLPRYSERQTVQMSAQPNQIKSTQSDARILVVEDNELVRKLTVKRLLALGFTAEQVSNGVDAVQYLEKDSKFDLVLSDVVMEGGMSGFDVAGWIQNNLPQCKVLLTSGFNEQMAEGNDVQAEKLQVLQKPYSLAELQQALVDILEQKTVGV